MIEALWPKARRCRLGWTRCASSGCFVNDGVAAGQPTFFADLGRATVRVRLADARAILISRSDGRTMTIVHHRWPDRLFVPSQIISLQMIIDYAQYRRQATR